MSLPVGIDPRLVWRADNVRHGRRVRLARLARQDSGVRDVRRGVPRIDRGQLDPSELPEDRHILLEVLQVVPTLVAPLQRHAVRVPHESDLRGARELDDLDVHVVRQRQRDVGSALDRRRGRIVHDEVVDLGVGRLGDRFGELHQARPVRGPELGHVELVFPFHHEVVVGAAHDHVQVVVAREKRLDVGGLARPRNARKDDNLHA